MKHVEPWREEWSLTFEAQDDGRVWLYLRAGPLSGGMFMCPSTALMLASEITDAAEQATAKKEKAA